MKGLGKSILIAMNDTNGDFLDKYDETIEKAEEILLFLIVQYEENNFRISFSINAAHRSYLNG